MRKVLNYKGVRVNSFGLPILKINNKEILGSSKKYFQYKYFNSTFKKISPKNLIVMYDIPHEMKKERDWFRRHLKKFNYIMIQKSVWVGPSPLPKDFLDYVKSIKLLGQLKTFKLAKPYKEDKKVF
jgi:hypothetical protein